MKNVGDVIGAFLIGVAVGTVIGILYAPQSGEETRKILSEKGSQTVEELNQKINNLKEEFEKLRKEASKFTGELLGKFTDKFEKKSESKVD
ncbi:MAG: YtxH domain-containing protein [Candidatus Calescibacterium sp.]|nr:YtxH domain-containing protein [Candidatus Calescibacterium sp.]